MIGKLTCSVEISIKKFNLIVFNCSVIDVGSEWRTFSNDKNTEDPSRVGGPENPLLSGSDLSTIIGPSRGSASLDEMGASKYHNRKTVSIDETKMLKVYCSVVL